MILYEMLNLTIYNQEVWIYETNVYDQHMPVFKGTVEDARGDSDGGGVWDYLMHEVDMYECNAGILIINVKANGYEDRMEEHYFNSDKWGKEKEKRPWRYSIEIAEELRERKRI